MMTLRDLQISKSAIITSVGGEGALRQHFLDMGVIPGTEVKLMKYAPMGDPMELMLHGYTLTLRLADAEKIEIVPLEEEVVELEPEEQDICFDIEHPGFGEGGKYHVKADENPLPAGSKLTFLWMRSLLHPSRFWSVFRSRMSWRQQARSLYT